MAGALTRHLSDGTPDSTFSFSREYYDVIAAAAVAGGELVIAARQFVYGADAATVHVLRLNPNGSIDSGFSAALVGAGDQRDGAQDMVQSDGKILVGGLFATFAGTPRQNIARLLAEGSIDASFNPPVMPAGTHVRSILPLPDGRTIIGGNFTSLDGNASVGLTRLLANGSVDSAFQAQGYARWNNTAIRALVLQPDGKVVVAGLMRNLIFPRTTSMIRILPDGALDQTFSISVATTDVMNDLVRQSDKLVGSVDRYIFRYNSDGSPDGSFSSSALSERHAQRAGHCLFD